MGDSIVVIPNYRLSRIRDKKSKYSNDTYTLKKRLLTFCTYQLERKIVVPKMVPDLFYYLVKSYEKKISGYAIIQILCVFAGHLIKQGQNF